jgi:hypothetical protein
MRQLASPKVRGSQNDIGNENPQDPSGGVRVVPAKKVK